MNSEEYASSAEEPPSPTCDKGDADFESQNAKAFAAAAHFIRKSVGPNADCASWDDIAKQEQFHVGNLNAAGLAADVREADLDQMPILSADTSEHKVLMPFEGTRVTKVTWPGVFGQIPIYRNGLLDRRNALPSEYLFRQALQTDVFASDIQFEGVSISSKPSMIIGAPSGQPSFVITQGFVTAADPRTPIPNEGEITAFMEENGFKRVPRS